MSEIVCPECLTRFRSSKDLVGESVSCARCKAVFVVVEPVVRPAARGDETRLPERAPLPRVTAKKSTKTSARKRKKRRTRNGPLLPRPVIFAAGIGAILIAAWALVPGLPDTFKKGTSGLLSMVRTADTIESLNHELTALYVELRGVLSEVTDELSSQSAAARMKKINGRLIDIQRRAVSSPTVSYAGLEAVLNDRTRLGAVVAVQNELDRLSFAKLTSKELSYALSKFTGLLKNDGRAESEDGAVLVDARNEQERIERERVEINQRLVTAILSANDAAGMARVA
jgi:hypothetical protein